MARMYAAGVSAFADSPPEDRLTAMHQPVTISKRSSIRRSIDSIVIPNAHAQILFSAPKERELACRAVSQLQTKA